MIVKENTRATLLLTVQFSGYKEGAAKPFGPVEWSRFLIWLERSGKAPEDLFTADIRKLMANWEDRSINVDRVEKLLDQGSELDKALERWHDSGVWLVTQSDARYPEKLIRRLNRKSPPLLFGMGNALLFDTPALAIVGSRGISEGDKKYSRDLGRFAALQGYTIVSGAARGVDENAMLGALEAGGTAIGYLPGRLLSISSSKKYSHYITKNDLLLVSPYHPESGFSVGNAMGRNKYIYCQSDAAIVVHAGTTGGTWSGALEALKQKWVPLWVKTQDDKNSGNHLLMEKGAFRLKDQNPETVSFKALTQPQNTDLINLQTSFLDSNYPDVRLVDSGEEGEILNRKDKEEIHRPKK